MRLAKYSGSVPHSACCQPQADLYSRSGYSTKCGLEINNERNREELIWEDWREKSGSQSGHTYCFQPPGRTRSLVPFDSLPFSVISNTQVLLPSIEYWETESQDIWERRSVWVSRFYCFPFGSRMKTSKVVLGLTLELSRRDCILVQICSVLSRGSPVGSTVSDW